MMIISPPKVPASKKVEAISAALFHVFGLLQTIGNKLVVYEYMDQDPKTLKHSNALFGSSTTPLPKRPTGTAEVLWLWTMTQL